MRAYPTFTALLVMLVGAPASLHAATRSLEFPFEDERYLQLGEKNGGMAYLTEGVAQDDAVPVVVYLHGLNERGPVHYWYGYFNNDLRTIADEVVATGGVRPFVLAAPSQTRDANAASRLWKDFDLDLFLNATEAALPRSMTLDRTTVIVIGHSGGGCNVNGGLLGTVSPFISTKPAGIVDVDACYDAELGLALAAAPTETPVWAFYQPFTWTRDFEGFRSAFLEGSAGRGDREAHFVVETRASADPHNTILERAFREALPALLPTKTPDPYE